MNKQHDSIDYRIRPRADLSNVRPTFEDRALLKRLPWPDKLGMIAMPESTRPTHGIQLGEVIALGPGATYSEDRNSGKKKDFRDGKRAAFECKIGDWVLFEQWHSSEFEQDGETYSFAFEEGSILAVVDKDAVVTR